MSCLVVKILLGIALINYVDSQNKDGVPAFMNKVENCSDVISRNVTDESESKEDLDISYLLFTRKNPQNEYIMRPNPESVANSTFNPCVGTIFLTHGYLVKLSKSNVMFDIKDELLKKGEFNVVVVDWTNYNVGFYTIEVLITVPKVSSDLTKMIKVLMSVTGIKPESLYLIGHSLGAHVSGYAGRNIPNIGRITGLDAAGPLYNILPKSWELSNTDALFVDAIHTNGGSTVFTGFGILKPYADQDYYPNGGSSQPGCHYFGTYLDSDKQTLPELTFIGVNNCNHIKSMRYYLESINNCEFIAVQCDSYSHVRRGKCSKKLLL